MADYYFEKVMDLWRVDMMTEGRSCIEKWKAGGELTEDEVEKLKKIFPDDAELIETELEDNPRAVLRTYAELVRIKGWGDEKARTELGISRENIADIRYCRKLKSKHVIAKIFNALLLALE